MKKQTIAIIALVIAQIFWGASYLMSDFALKVFPAATLVSIRISIAAAVLGVVGLITGQLKKIEFRDWKYFLLAAFAEPFVYFLCEAKARTLCHKKNKYVLMSFCLKKSVLMLNYSLLLTPCYLLPEKRKVPLSLSQYPTTSLLVSPRHISSTLPTP